MLRCYVEPNANVMGWVGWMTPSPPVDPEMPPSMVTAAVLFCLALYSLGGVWFLQ